MSYDYQLVVIGSGSGGKDAAILGARAGLRVLLVEKDSLGGTCFHRGVYAMRALHACAMNLKAAGESQRSGLSVGALENDWADWVKTQRRVGARLTEDLIRVLENLGVEIRLGKGKLLNPNQIEISDPYGSIERVSAENIILATGSRPSFASESGPKILNSDQMLKNAAVPNHLLIIGGGFIGCEFASIHRALGAGVTLVEGQKRLLPGWDEVAGEHLWEVLACAGVNIILNHKVELPGKSFPADRPAFDLGSGMIISPDLTLVSVGRKPNVDELGLESIGMSRASFISVNDEMRVGFQNLFAIGDVNGLALLDSVAFAKARVAIQTILGKPARFDLRSVPRCVHTDPPVAAAGWTEQEARAAGYEVEVISETLRLVSDDDRSIVNPETTKMKLVVQPDKRKILGCLAIGLNAAEIVNLVATAIRTGLTATDLADLSLVHPSASEALVRSLQSRWDFFRS
jgi:dihydrolipoamide dehydrogenase